MSKKKSVLVLGGGPGGYSAAIYLADLGAQVTLVEKQYLGGTCLNVGCIPTKAFVEASNNYAMIQDAITYGIRINGDVTVDSKKLAKFKNNVVKQVRSGVAMLLEHAGVTVISGTGKLIDTRTVEITLDDESTQLATADAVVLATGSSEIELPGFEPDGEFVLNSTQMLDMKELPESVAIIGGGVIGIEFASFFARFGKKVTIIELTPSIIPTEDCEVAKTLSEFLADQSVEILTETKAKSILSKNENGVALQLENASGETRELTVEKVLVCVGRRANLNRIGLEAAGLEHNGKFISTNAQMQTNVPGIYAVGDITASPQLAHVAYYEARIAALSIMGQQIAADYSAIPFCIFSYPEVARVGLTEQAAREKYPELKIENESFVGNAKATIHRENMGFVKLLIDGATDKVVGCSIIGPKATELIAEPTLAVNLGLDIHILSETINAHPSLSEVIGETACTAVGLKLHSI